VSESVLVVENLCQVDKRDSVFGTGLFRVGECPRSGEPLSGQRTKGIPCSGQNCSVSDSVLVLKNLCQGKWTKVLQFSGRTFGKCPRREKPLSGKRPKALQLSGQDFSVTDSVLVVKTSVSMRTKWIPCSGQDCSVSDNVHDVNNLCQSIM
jgi:hypothetical protein